MPKFLIEATHRHVEIESASFTVEADDAEAALARAKAMDEAGEIDWSEDDEGWDENDTWEVTPEE
jgi:hypothetical protein